MIRVFLYQILSSRNSVSDTGDDPDNTEPITTYIKCRKEWKSIHDRCNKVETKISKPLENKSKLCGKSKCSRFMCCCCSLRTLFVCLFWSNLGELSVVPHLSISLCTHDAVSPVGSCDLLAVSPAAPRVCWPYIDTRKYV